MLRGRPILSGACSGKVLVETVVSLFTEKTLPFCTRKAAGFEAGPEQGQPWRRGSGTRKAARARHQSLAGSHAVCPPQQTFLVCLPNAKHSENAPNTNACLVGDGSDYTQGTGESSPTHGFAGKRPADCTRTRDHVHCKVCFNPALSPQKPRCLAWLVESKQDVELNAKVGRGMPRTGMSLTRTGRFGWSLVGSWLG